MDYPLRIHFTALKQRFRSPARDSAEELPLVHRLAIVYLMLPVVIWLVGWHQWWLGIPVSIVVAVALLPALVGPWRVSPRPTAVLVLLVALGWVMSTAAGGVFDVHNFDWIKHRAIFLDLSRGAWPVHLPYWASSLGTFFPGEVELTGDLLRYYLAYYLTPGMVGSWFGAAALNWAVPLWTWCGAALVLLLFTRDFKGWKVLAAAAVFVFFSGMDIVSVIAVKGWQWLEFRVSLAGWPALYLGTDFLEWDRFWNVKVQFLSHMTDLMWVPQHFIPGAIYALLLVQLNRHRRFLAVSGVVVGVSLLWSPFVAVGLLPFVVVLIIQNGVRPFLPWQNLVVAPLLTLLMLAYLTSDTGDIPHFWLWEFAGWPNVLRGLPLLYVTEFLALAALLVLLRPRLRREPFFVAAVGTMLLLPLYYFGLHNDLVMRGLIPALALLCFYCAHALSGRPPSDGRAGGSIRDKALAGVVVAVLVVGALGPFINLARANSDRNAGDFWYHRYGPDYSTPQAVGEPIVNQYLAAEVSPWYRLLLRDAGGQPTAVARELLIAAEFDVYLLNGEVLVYAKTPCTEADTEAKFIMHVFYGEERPLAHDTLDFAFNQGAGLLADGTCVTSRALP